MAGPPQTITLWPNGLRDAAQELDRLANHLPVTLADLQHSQQQQQTNIQQLISEAYVLCFVCLVY